MIKDGLYEKAIIHWRKKNGCCFAIIEGKEFCLDEPMTKVWDLIDGIRTISEISEIFCKTSTYDKDMAFSFVENSIEILLGNNLVIERGTHEDIMGW